MDGERPEDEAVASTDETSVRLRLGTSPGGSLTFHDALGARRRVVGGEEFEVDMATAEQLVKGNQRVHAVPPIELELRRERPDLDQDVLRELVSDARTWLERLGTTATRDAIRTEVTRRQPPPPGLPTAPRRRPGRPRGTRTVARGAIVARFRSLKRSYGRAPTQKELAENLEPPITPRTLQAHLDDYDLSWPIE